MAIEVFISYAHKDGKLRDEFDAHLSNLRNQEIISDWYDGDILPGAEWEEQIMNHLKTSHIILLLISKDFLASKFCYSVELKEAIARHNAQQARVIPIILRPTDWEGAPFAKLQALPTNAKPVVTWSNRDAAFKDVVTGIRRAIQDLNASIGVSPNPIVSPASSSGTTSVGGAAGVQVPIWSVPYRRNPFFHRPGGYAHAVAHCAYSE